MVTKGGNSKLGNLKETRELCREKFKKIILLAGSIEFEEVKIRCDKSKLDDLLFCKTLITKFIKDKNLNI